MSSAFRIKKFAASVAAFLLHFAHGGLVVAGLLAIAFLAHQLQDSGLTLWRGTPAVEAEAIEKVSASGQSGAEAGLKPGMRSVAEYLARKYRVSSVAIEPLVGAAEQVGGRVGLDPLLILAVMAIESRFNPIAESVMGAQGLMQVIPRFHQDKIEQVDDAPSEGALLDPVKNIQVGAQVLKESIRRAGSLQGGLQQYAGAPSDPGSQYASKVMAEKQRLEQALRRAKQPVREA